ncbi:hypothetical protein PHPALM_1314 [Phytophthora palmivora]|uniref:RING-type domain-containing protein n=1 Tax=Phytophthora palmivora TaxID=4796 RepID=A0A2P4YSL4_9STRA|nr:hypothetical protein PHPALM_1314 [Phytophthora palmivora]
MRPEVAASHSASALTSPASSIHSRVRLLTSSITPPSSVDAGSSSWVLPPLIPLPRRFLPFHFREDNNPMMHFQDSADNADAGPTQQPEEIDLTVSSSEDEGGAQDTTGTTDDVIEILEVSETTERPPPAPLRRKRRRPVPGAASNSSDVLVIKRQRVTDVVRSTESTDVSIQNSEVVEEFKRRLKCSICLDVLEDMTSTICGHVFCAGCIHQAIRASGKCPLCQRRLHFKDTHRLFF